MSGMPQSTGYSHTEYTALLLLVWLQCQTRWTAEGLPITSATDTCVELACGKVKPHLSLAPCLMQEQELCHDSARAADMNLLTV